MTSPMTQAQARADQLARKQRNIERADTERLAEMLEDQAPQWGESVKGMLMREAAKRLRRWEKSWPEEMT